MIPFKISKKNAEASFLKWIKSRFWAPGKLKTNYVAEKITGVYITCWTYDSDTYSFYTAEEGTHYFETVIEWVEENGQRKQVTRQEKRTRWVPTSGYYSRFFNDVLVNASKKINESLMSRLEPFHLDELTPYDSRYMSGFTAEKYSINLKEGWETSKIIIDKNIYSDVIAKIAADEVRGLNINTSYRNIKYKHILLPIWISAFTYKNKLYQYWINGQTGEVQGHHPISILKILTAILIGVIIAALILMVVHK